MEIYEYYINGWKESERYFMSFGFTADEIERMKSGEVIRRIDSCSDNEFRIVNNRKRIICR